MLYKILIGVLLGVILMVPAGLYGQYLSEDSLNNRLKILQTGANYSSNREFLDTRNELLAIYARTKPDSAILVATDQINLTKKAKYSAGEADANRIVGIAYFYKSEYQQALMYFDKALAIAESKKIEKGKGRIYNNIALVYSRQGNYQEAINQFFKALELGEADNDNYGVSSTLNNLATIYYEQKNYKSAREYYQKALTISNTIGDLDGIVTAYNNIGEIFLAENNLSEARNYLEKSISLAKQYGFVEILMHTENMLAEVFTKNNQPLEAAKYYRLALASGQKAGVKEIECISLIGLAKLNNSIGNKDSALYFGSTGLQLALEIGVITLIRDANKVLYQIHEKNGAGMQALYFYKAFQQYQDSLTNQEVEKSIALMSANYEYSQKELIFNKKNLQQRWIIFSALAGFITLSIIALLVNRNRQKLNKANISLNNQNLQIAKQKQSLEETIHQLKDAQALLIHSEKMASMGELTAGIAHEIQNPLNFVNNFAEVSREMVDELSEMIAEGNHSEVESIALDLKENLQKIETHGKRADGIVKSMLYHSRSSSNKAEHININTLADEYLRLSYHGLRAKDKSFNAKMDKVFDENIPLINAIPQELGRALLNLINNAFYAVSEKGKLGIANYQPKVTVTTQKLSDQKIQITIEDNGMGIPETLKQKIFQPFFTTKPTGIGTGLGLSITFDIITKVHGGELEVASKEGEYTLMKIILPIDLAKNSG